MMSLFAKEIGHNQEKLDERNPLTAQVEYITAIQPHIGENPPLTAGITATQRLIFLPIPFP